MTEQVNRIKLGVDIDAWADEDIVRLTDEEIAKLIDLECAQEGIQLLPDHPGPKPQEPKLPDPTVTVFDVELPSAFTVTLSDEHAADRLATLMNDLRPFVVVETYQPYGQPRYVKEIGTTQVAEITRKSVLSKEQWDTRSTKHESIQAEVAAWKKASGEYEEIAAKRREKENGIRDKIRTAGDRIARVERAQASWDRYLALAEGDRETALRFMYAAEPANVEALGMEADAKRAMDPSEDRVASRAIRRETAKIRAAAGADVEEEDDADEDDAEAAEA